MTSCPPLEVLGRIGSGQPGSSSDVALDAHINGCPFCQDILDGIAAKESSAESRGVVDPEKLPRIPGFTMERELGRGGMGVVFLARELHPDREVAVKVLSSGPFATPRDRDRWLKEARAAARVRHPHIVQLYQVGQADGWLYLVLEYLAGGSLKERLSGPLSPRIAAALLVPIARAIEQLHRAGIWHLDLKPANILIDAPPGTPLDRAPLKVTDFGIARSQDDAGNTGSNVGDPQGTLLYMAPEQFDGRRCAIGPATDLYAMGVILYELLAGRPPFLAENAIETIRRVQSEDPVPPRRLNPAIPRDLETVCLKCLEKDTARRYSSAEALAADLCRFVDGHPISARHRLKARTPLALDPPASGRCRPRRVFGTVALRGPCRCHLALEVRRGRAKERPGRLTDDERGAGSSCRMECDKSVAARRLRSRDSPSSPGTNKRPSPSSRREAT